MLAKKGKTFTDAVLVKSYILPMVKELCPEKMKQLLSFQWVVTRQLKRKAK